jgi:hypothetical protein
LIVLAKLPKQVLPKDANQVQIGLYPRSHANNDTTGNPAARIGHPFPKIRDYLNFTRRLVSRTGQSFPLELLLSIENS